MKYCAFVIISIALNVLTFGQDCPILIAPLDGATNVPVDTSISWEFVEGVTGYIISIGTTPGATDIINQQPNGSSTIYSPPLGLPDNTQIYITITLFFFDQPDIPCQSQTFRTVDITVAPNCSSLENPVNGTLNVNVAANISWNYVVGATGYVITVGTGPGLGDIVNNLNVGNVLTFNPPTDLPDETEIFVEVIPYNENGNANSCSDESFTTGALAALPICTTIISPIDGAINVELTPFIEWEVVPGAIGYLVYIGTTPFVNDILDGNPFTSNSTFVINFISNSIYFIRIIPYNDAGEAIGCSQTTFSTILGCGPFFNAGTGELETLNPVLTLPDQVGICLNEIPTTVTAPDIADGYRWYMYNVNDEAVLISEAAVVQISEEGIYSYEAYNYSDESAFQIECSSIMDFTVVSSEIATILGVSITDDVNGNFIRIEVEGIGDYEYSLDSIEGPYQDSNSFSNAPENSSVIYVRDRNGCGSVAFDIAGYANKKGFPKFFTPNGDGFNDYWQHRPKDDDMFRLEVIYIFNRYGKLLKTLNPSSIGWNGKLNDDKLNTSDFWYRAVTIEGESFVGHFTLKR